VECFHGQHRILATNQYLEPDSRCKILRQYFHNGYTNSKSTRDAEIFRRIRPYNRSGQQDLEQDTWCYLSASKCKDLRQLLTNGALTKVFDNLLH
ncbi:hypothetical protein C7212DRAFT_220526, partial [Tuber magnatum]